MEEIAICIRCQSSNPTFTKYCLTCGLSITPEMRVSASSPVAVKMAPMSSSSVATVTAIKTELVTDTSKTPDPEAQAQTTEETQSQPKTKEGGSSWLSRFLSRS
ncbi:MAG: hypothetical protein J0M03_08455 [Acidobacteria bacterium]|nr:hypothetical protein [Acidobacteriota bacterium]